MCDIYRIIECRAGSCEEIAFVEGEQNTKTYLQASYALTESEPDVFYFAIKIQVER